MNKEDKALDITQLPDYSAIKKLAATLWQQDTSYHGTAIMVGAGFSRSAATTGDSNKKLPLWGDLSKVLSKELDTSNSSDPLRLAEEYYAYFGKQALHDLIRQEINDAAWTPSNMYKELLELPWSEVLTTNWDTLLEKASKEIHEPAYSIVYKPEDLASKNSPRIVKLHGTINITSDLIFTQEDYRTYPKKYAAFVNFARQVFIENELCLLGFSGDDPNFIQWTGWVRDNLVTHARRIYLVGALSLTSTKRRYLESINITPIDLGELVSEFDNHDTRHLKAINIFLKTLKDMKPKRIQDWMPTRQTHLSHSERRELLKDPSDINIKISNTISTLTSDRKSYPNWLICPSKLRWLLNNELGQLNIGEDIFKTLTRENKEKLLYEIVWLSNITYVQTPHWLTKELTDICNPERKTYLSKKQQMEIALYLLKRSRFLSNNNKNDDLIGILEKNNKYWKDSINETIYFLAIKARDNLNYSELEEQTKKISENSYHWKIKKAMLLSEIGLFDESERLLTSSYKELLSLHHNDKGSIYILSRLAWAHWLIKNANIGKNDTYSSPFPFIYKDYLCDPYSYIESLSEIILNEIKEQEENIEPLFEPGYYKDNSRRINFSSETPATLLFDGISYDTGTPLRLELVNLLLKPATNIIKLEDINNKKKISIAIQAAASNTSDVIKEIFSRINIAKMSEDDIEFALTSCINSINYWIEKISGGNNSNTSFYMNKLSILLEILSRIQVRVIPEVAKNNFRLGGDILRKEYLRHPWLSRPLINLINYSLESIPYSQHQHLLKESLCFPLSDEDNQIASWPNPIISHPGKRKSDKELNDIIYGIIDKINLNDKSKENSNTALIERLIPLVNNDFLTKREMDKLRKAIFIGGDKINHLLELRFFYHTYSIFFSELPATISSRIYNLLFPEHVKFDTFSLKSIVSASQFNKHNFYPEHDKACSYFHQMIEWRKNEDDIKKILSIYDEDYIGELIGSALSSSIIPSLPKNYLKEEHFNKFSLFYREVSSPSSIVSFIYFIGISKEIDIEIESLIKRGLQGSTNKLVAYSSHAILKWRELSNNEITNSLISRIIYLIISGKTTALPALLWAAREAYNNDWLSSDSIDILIDSIPIIYESSNYAPKDNTKVDTINISLVRAACIKLAKDILKNIQQTELLTLLKEAKNDPLPEVRFAEINEDYN